MNDWKGKKAFCSWSGGKDSCLALYKAIKTGLDVKNLFTMCIEEGERTRSHGLRSQVVEAQTESLNLPLLTCNASWDQYEEKFVARLQSLHKEGIEVGIFGDIDIEPNRQWEEKVCVRAGLKPYIPLWKVERSALLEEFLELGFKALVVASNEEKLGNRYLGRLLDSKLVEELTAEGIDPSGEEGEYHTVVIDGPIFSKPIDLQPGEQALRSGYWFQDFSVSL
jgi:uncharacterized protein (TIGR00290 family)